MLSTTPAREELMVSVWLGFAGSSFAGMLIENILLVSVIYNRAKNGVASPLLSPSLETH